ncbi:MAG: S8 family serine peptidase, partial [Candidatus Neomarinimicrobiota bacterium]
GLDEATLAVPNDPLFGLQSHLSQINAPAAWDMVKGEQGDVVIAVVDGGTNWQHEDLVDNVWTNPGEIAGDGVDNDFNGFPDDVHGWNFADSTGNPDGIVSAPLNAQHGTAVAGIAAAATDNSIGIAGVSWNAQLMAVNATCPADSFICFGYEGIVYAALAGADFINVSWGSTHVGLTSFEERSLLRLVKDIIDFATENDALVVAAAGNGVNDTDVILHLPASAPAVLSVAATRKDSDVMANFTNYGVTVDVFAPGEDINSLLPGDVYTLGGSGTSFSTPMALGLAALVKTRFPSMSPAQVAQQLRVTAESIDDANPSLAGRLGKGRLDAQRAATDTSIPAIRITEVTFADAGADGIIQNGEQVDVTVSLTNYLADATGVMLTLSVDEPDVTILDGSASFASLATGETADAAFRFRVGELPDEHPLRFLVDIDDGSYRDRDRDLFKLYANEPLVFTHDTGPVQVSITAEGNIGWTGFADLSAGEGFVYQGTNLLFEGGLLVGTSTGRVSDCIRGPGEVLERDFGLAPGEQLLIREGPVADEEGSVVIGDHLALFPIGLTVLQESYADNDAAHDDFVIFRYVITNSGLAPLSNLYAGLFFDWDISQDGQQDYARFDGTRRMGSIQNDGLAPTFLAATKLLTDVAGLSYRAIDNPTEIYDGFTGGEKWAYLTGGIQTQTLNSTDASTLTAVGPLALDRGEAVEVAFAVIGAGSLTELDAHADNAQQYWETAIQPAQANHAPVFTSVLPDSTIKSGESLEFTYQAGDADGDALTYSLANPPTGASLDSESGVLTYQSSAADSGVMFINVTVSDGELVSAARSRVTLRKLRFTLAPSYANPFGQSPNLTTIIGYEISRETHVKLAVYDLRGRRVRMLVNELQPPDEYKVVWNAVDDAGHRVSTGIYFYRIEAGSFSASNKILLIK